MNSAVFFARHPVFRIEEFETFLIERNAACTDGVVDPTNRKRLLNYHQKQGHIQRLRQGLYASALPGMDAKDYPADPFLIASCLTPDAVLAYHTALSFLGVAHSVSNRIIVLSEQHHARPFDYRGTVYLTTQPPAVLPDKDRMTIGIEQRQRQGMTVRVTGWERTIVDAFDRLSLVGGWNEAWRSLEAIDVYLKLDFLIDYALLLNEASTCACVGYFLEQHRDRFLVKQRHLDRLKARRPKQPHYVQRNRKSALHQDASRRYLPEWNLWVPTERAENESMEFDDEIRV